MKHSTMKRSIMQIVLLLGCMMCGLSLYLQMAYRIGRSIRLSVFSRADMQVYVLAPHIYNAFQMLPVILGMIIILRKYQYRTQILSYRSRQKIFRVQLFESVAFSGISAAVYAAAAWMNAMLWEKEWINWADIRSYFHVITKQQQPDIRYWEVLLITGAILLAKNLILAEVILLAWWGCSNIVYGIIGVTGICFAEYAVPRFYGLYGDATAEYRIWLEHAQQIKIAFIAIGCALALWAVTKCLLKRKEF